MQRRSFLRHAGLAGILASGTAPAFAQGQEVRWRLASSFPKSLDTLFGTGEVIARRVAALTGNRFRIQQFAAGELVPGLQALDATANGTVECSHSVAYYYIGKDPTFGFGAAMPFGLNSRQQLAWMYQGGGLALMRDFYREYGVMHFPAGNTGVQMGGWFRKEVRSLAEIKGVKMRIAGFAGQVLAEYGLVPQQLAGPDVYPALEKGTIDAVEWVGPYDDEKLGFARVAKFYYYPGWWEGGPQVDLYVNLKAWEALPAEFQQALDVACFEGTMYMLTRYDQVNPPALRRLVAAGAQLRAFPRDLMEACYKSAHALYDDVASKNAKFRKVYDAWRAYRDEQLLWSRVAEGPFDAFMQSMQARGASGTARRK